MEFKIKRIGNFIFNKSYFINNVVVFLAIGFLLALLLHFFAVDILKLIGFTDFASSGFLNYFDFLFISLIFLILLFSSKFNRNSLCLSGFFVGLGFSIAEFLLKLTYFPDSGNSYFLLKTFLRVSIASIVGFGISFGLARVLSLANKFGMEKLKRIPFWGPLYFLESFLLTTLLAQWIAAFLIEAQHISHFEGASGYAYLLALPWVFIACWAVLWLLYFLIRKNMTTLVAIDILLLLILTVFFLRNRNSASFFILGWL